ncbi:MAG: DUF3987 domain-containing protein [Meiothermus sp.]|uniref:DUF3987 domain-containing protein n=1 Tax=Meiothermus sp. TaxID=1955249 RepID=UPI00298ED599|nr:DUF3987 domain-containing protein [Meiothermus sp.]MDW8480903.1 DUF3987 domain-containing protein [Meiothermus sp.]
MGRWQKWWEGATPGHPLLQRYLHARGLCIPPPPSLRLALWGDTPVMLARITGPRGDLVGLHLTTLEPGGRARKEKRLAAGSKPLGGAIRLFPLEEGQPLALAEGIETALAVHQATGWPAWATVSASFMPYVHIPPEVREVVICPDNDPPGLEAGRRLARRLPGEGRKVRLAGRTHPLSLYLLSIAESGERKSTTDEIATRPIREAQRGLYGAQQEALAEWEKRFALWEAEKRRIVGDKRRSRADREAALRDLGPPPSNRGRGSCWPASPPTRACCACWLRAGRAAGCSATRAALSWGAMR